MHNLTVMNLELTQHCNARCTYCPVSVEPHPKKVMNESTFLKSLELAKKLGIKKICPNHFGEPLLDPNFINRMIAVAEHDINLEIFTNGLVWKDKHINGLLPIKDKIDRILINLPSVDGDEYNKLVGKGRKLLTVIDTVSKLKQSGFCVEVICLGVAKEQLEKNCLQISKTTGVPVVGHFTHSRAGSINNHHICHSTYIESPRLTGCSRFNEEISIDVNGDFLICCLDFKKEYTYFSIENFKSNHPDYLQARESLNKYVSGNQIAPSNFICRKCVFMNKTISFSTIYGK